MDDSADFSNSFNDENTLNRLNEYAVVSELKGNMEFEVVKTDSITRNRIFNEDHVYPNFSSPKGLALIFNNRKFTCGLSERKGTQFDERKIRQLLTKLGYRVIETKENLGGQDMLESARQFAIDEAHKLYDSCVVVVLTHGKSDSFCGTDGVLVNVHDFIDCFNAINAPFLKGKPKLFFIQACRGNKHDFGTDFADSENAAKDSSSTDPRHPILADILISYATTPNYVSWRNSRTGSWFIQSICEIFSQHAADESIFSLLTTVNERVANFYKTSETGEKQIPQFHSSLRKKFYFFPGDDNVIVPPVQHEATEHPVEEISNTPARPEPPFEIQSSVLPPTEASVEAFTKPKLKRKKKIKREFDRIFKR